VCSSDLCDDRPDWRPTRFQEELLGCRLIREFLIAKVLDYRDRNEELERSTNPFAAVVQAHLAEMATRDDPAARQVGKIRLVKGLYQRGFDKDDVRQLYRLIDWLMVLPTEQDRSFKDEIYAFEREKQMPYVTSTERLAREEGREEGLQKGRHEGREDGLEAERRHLHKVIATGLEQKFGSPGKRLAARVRKCEETARLLRVNLALITATTLEEVETALGKGA